MHVMMLRRKNLYGYSSTIRLGSPYRDTRVFEVDDNFEGHNADLQHYRLYENPILERDRQCSKFPVGNRHTFLPSSAREYISQFISHGQTVTAWSPHSGLLACILINLKFYNERELNAGKLRVFLLPMAFGNLGSLVSACSSLFLSNVSIPWISE